MGDSRLRQKRRRADEDHIVLAEELRSIGWRGIGSGGFAEEGLHFSSWGIGDEHAAGPGADGGIGMGDFAWTND